MSGKSSRPASHRRVGRRTKRVRAAPTAPAYITRQIPYYEFLGEEGLVMLENQADWLMEEIGLEFRGDTRSPQDLERSRR